MMNPNDRIRRVKAYRVEHECSLQEAIRAVDRTDLIADIRGAMRLDATTRDLLLRIVEFIGK